MPTSSPENLDIVGKWFSKIAPRTVIDVGCGEGTYAKLLKSNEHWTAIEAWGNYVNDYDLNNVYDHIIIADVRYIDSKYLKADLIIMGDMLEHMTKQQAKDLINICKTKADNLIISVPVQHLDQEPYEGNWFEVHVDHWSYQEMLDFLGDNTESIEGEVVARYWWRS